LGNVLHASCKPYRCRDYACDAYDVCHAYGACDACDAYDAYDQQAYAALPSLALEEELP